MNQGDQEDTFFAEMMIAALIGIVVLFLLYAALGVVLDKLLLFCDIPLVLYAMHILGVVFTIVPFISLSLTIPWKANHERKEIVRARMLGVSASGFLFYLLSLVWVYTGTGKFLILFPTCYGP